MNAEARQTRETCVCVSVHICVCCRLYVNVKVNKETFESDETTS